MANLDPRTILVVAAFMGPIMAAVLLAIRRAYASTVRGLGWWAQGAWWVFAGIVTITSRNSIPLFVAAVLGNFMLLLGGVQWALGTEKFLGLPSRVRYWCVLLAADTVALIWWLVVDPSFKARVTVVGVSIVGMLLVNAYSLIQARKYPFATRFIVAVLTLACLNWTVRITATWLDMLGPTLLASNPLNVALGATQTVVSLMIMIGFVLLATERVREEFEKLASRDSLTGALMRRTWLDAAVAEVDRSRRHGRALSVATMDLDFFKKINDSLGHQAGDQTLIHFAELVRGHLRGHDKLGRMGGEEFVLLLPETALQDAGSVAERIRAACAAAEGPARYTVSIGVATLEPGDGGIQELLARADAALYRAKAKGRNRVESDPDLASVSEFPGGVAPGSTTGPTPAPAAATDGSVAPAEHPVKSSLRHESPRRG